jgi:hypothetical protein
MSVAQTARDLHEQCPGLVPAVGTVFGECLPEGWPVDVLESQIWRPVSHAVAQNLDHMIRVDPLCQLQFALETGDVVGLVCVGGVQELEGDDRACLLVARLPDDPHASTADLLEQRETLQRFSPARPLRRRHSAPPVCGVVSLT